MNDRMAIMYKSWQIVGKSIFVRMFHCVKCSHWCAHTTYTHFHTYKCSLHEISTRSDLSFLVRAYHHSARTPTMATRDTHTKKAREKKIQINTEQIEIKRTKQKKMKEKLKKISAQNQRRSDHCRSGGRTTQAYVWRSWFSLDQRATHMNQQF